MPKLRLFKNSKTMELVGLLSCILIVGCGLLGSKVRYDAAISPISQNFHTVLMETTCQGKTQLGYGQGGCSFADDEPMSGELILHTPLPGAIHMVGKLCGVDSAQYHNDVQGSFHIKMDDLFRGVPKTVTACVVDIFVSWDLIKGMKSDYPLDGMIGRFYYRRRMPSREVATYEWGPNDNVMGNVTGVAFNQLRAWSAAGEFPASEPLELKIKLPRSVEGEGKYRLYGCGKGISEDSFTGDEITIASELLVGLQPVQGGCMMFGYAVGKDDTGKPVIVDLAAGLEVFGKDVMRLAGNVTLQGDKVCYDAEPSVSVAILNHGMNNKVSTKLTDCFKMPEDGEARLGFFTHKGRSVYAIVSGGKVQYVQ